MTLEELEKVFEENRKKISQTVIDFATNTNYSVLHIACLMCMNVSTIEHIIWYYSKTGELLTQW